MSWDKNLFQRFCPKVISPSDILFKYSVTPYFHFCFFFLFHVLIMYSLAKISKICRRQILKNFALYRNTRKMLLHWRLFASGDLITIFMLVFFLSWHFPEWLYRKNAIYYSSTMVPRRLLWRFYFTSSGEGGNLLGKLCYSKSFTIQGFKIMECFAAFIISMCC